MEYIVYFTQVHLEFLFYVELHNSIITKGLPIKMHNVRLILKLAELIKNNVETVLVTLFPKTSISNFK